MNNNKMNQSTISFKELADKLDKFDLDRGWTDLSPEDLAKSIMLEGAELLEHYQWDNTLRNRGSKTPEKNIDDIRHEVADILIYLLKFCRETKVDIVDAALEKLEKVGTKYPVGYNKSEDSERNYEEYLKIKKAHRINKK